MAPDISLPSKDIGYYEAGELVGFGELTNAPAWLERGLARPAVQRGLAVP